MQMWPFLHFALVFDWGATFNTLHIMHIETHWNKLEKYDFKFCNIQGLNWDFAGWRTLRSVAESWTGTKRLLTNWFGHSTLADFYNKLAAVRWIVQIQIKCCPTLQHSAKLECGGGLSLKRFILMISIFIYSSDHKYWILCIKDRNLITVYYSNICIIAKSNISHIIEIGSCLMIIIMYYLKIHFNCLKYRSLWLFWYFLLYSSDIDEVVYSFSFLSES